MKKICTIFTILVLLMYNQHIQGEEPTVTQEDADTARDDWLESKNIADIANLMNDYARGNNYQDWLSAEDYYFNVYIPACGVDLDKYDQIVYAYDAHDDLDINDAWAASNLFSGVFSASIAQQHYDVQLWSQAVAMWISANNEACESEEVWNNNLFFLDQLDIMVTDLVDDMEQEVMMSQMMP